MFTWMRTHQRVLLIVVTVLTIIAFVFLYSITDPSALATNQIAKVYGRDLSLTDFQREGRKFQLSLSLGLTDYASSLGATGGDEGLADFVVNKLIIDHQGRALGIQPGDEEIKNAIAALPAFQTGGQFDPQKYQQLVVNSLAPQGFTEVEIQELVRNSLILQRIRETLNAAPFVSETEIAYLTRMFQPVSGLAITFDRADFAAKVKITPEQIDEAFKAGAARLVTPERRTARFVRFPLPADAQKLEGKARIDAQQKIADASDAFATRAAAEGFEKAAHAAGLKIETTPPFDARGQTAPSPDLGNLADAVAASVPTAAIAPVAFTLTTKDPVTGVLASGDEFLVAELAQVTPSRPMTLEEARPEITRELTEAAATRELDAAAAAGLASLRAAAAAGQPVAAAAQAAGLKTQPFANILLMDQSTAFDMRRFADAAVVLQEGEISGLRREEAGGYAVWLEKRAPVDAKAAAENRTQLQAGILAQREGVLWMEWLRAAQKEADVRFNNPDQG